MEEKKRSVASTMAVISVIIIVLGLLFSIALYTGLSGEIARGADTELMVEGTNIAPIVGLAGKAGAAALSVIVAGASFLLVILQWIVYAVIKIVRKSIDSVK